MRKVTKSDCAGCEDDFYNHPNPVSNSSQCWMLEDAELSKLKPVGIHDRPPWKVTEGVLLPKCYHCQGYVFISPEKAF